MPHFLEDIHIYPAPNPGLSQVLKGPKMEAVVAEATSKVVAVYVQRITAVTQPKRRNNPNMLGSIEAGVSIGGYDNDRWVGEIKNTAEYAGAVEFGRKNPAPGQRGSTYSGKNYLRDSLYAVLPPI